jgi:hypothetical protein
MENLSEVLRQLVGVLERQERKQVPGVNYGRRATDYLRYDGMSLSSALISYLKAHRAPVNLNVAVQAVLDGGCPVEAKFARKNACIAASRNPLLYCEEGMLYLAEWKIREAAA